MYIYTIEKTVSTDYTCFKNQTSQWGGTWDHHIGEAIWRAKATERILYRSYADLLSRRFWAR
ncbi:hypothetical protein K250101E9_38740 [Enterocloster aldenensis]